MAIRSSYFLISCLYKSSGIGILFDFRKKSDKIHYYSELLGMKDTIAEEYKKLLETIELRCLRGKLAKIIKKPHER